MLPQVCITSKWISIPCGPVGLDGSSGDEKNAMSSIDYSGIVSHLMVTKQAARGPLKQISARLQEHRNMLILCLILGQDL